MLLVNKDNPVGPDFVPKHLVEVKEESKIHFIDYKTYLAFLGLRAKIQSVGLDIGIDSAYRSYMHQKRVLDFYFEKMGDSCYSRVALPGCSEHHTGLALDFALRRNGNLLPDDPCVLDPEVQAVFRWMADYGFILRYPLGKEDITGYCFEPWHLRYVGEAIAHEITDLDITLEEFVLQKRLS